MPYMAQPKAPGTEINYSFEWADWLSTGTTIQSSTWAADTGLTVAALSIQGSKTTATISGGTNGVAYRARNTVEADNGETDTREVVVVVNPAAAVGPGFQADMLLYRLWVAKKPDDPALPLPDYYEQAIHDAISQINQDVPATRTGTLNIIAGQATYTLPTDFLFMISMPSPTYPGGVLLSDSGITPVGLGFEEHYDIAGNQITFTPTPGYTAARQYRYAAGHVLVDGVYPNLSMNAVRIALLYAQYLVHTEQANTVAGSGWKYQIGDEMVDTTSQGKSIMVQGEALLKQYQAAVKQQKGYGIRAGYSEVAAWV